MNREAEKKTETPSDWIGKYFYVPDPRDPVTGERLPPGPMRLTELQKRIIDEALSKDEFGNFKYTTVIYSAPKKSGKSAVTSAVALYMGMHNPNSYVACMANDEKQSSARLYLPIYTCFRLHIQYSGPFAAVRANKDEVTLPNYTKIEAVPCDAAGEAGAQPIGVFFSELWGYQTEKKQRLFVEMTIPPTLYGRAIRWIETYAGYTGESLLLEQLYDVGFTHGEPHPDFLDVQGKFGPAVRVNQQAQMFVYWDTEHRMPWQTPEYYRMEQATMPASEFRRVHGNEWVSAMSSFVEEEWWNACEDKNLPVLNDGDKTPVVVGIDMAVSRDCAALVAVTRSPFNPESEIAVRAVRIFRPSQYGGIIDQEKLIRPVIEDWHKRWNVVCWVYDPKEMAKLAQDMTREGVGWFKAFGQVQPRTVSDKQLHDMILAKQIAWNSQSTFGDVGFRGDGSEKDTLYRHIVQAGATTTGDAYRLEKLSASAKIDGAVALSQAAYTALRLAISNMEFNQTSLIKLLASGQITLEEFSRRVQHAHPELVEARQG